MSRGEITASNNKTICEIYNRAKLWQIGLFVLNNTATNVAMVLIGFYAFFTQNILGLAAVIVGLLATVMRIFDGITDPIVGYLIDRTNGRFGKFRPYMLLGNVILFISLVMIFRTPGEWGTTTKYIYTTVWYVIYVLGYTFQTAVTKGAQSALTNDPEQRPLFTLFDAIYNATLFNVSALVITTIMAPKYAQKLNDPILWRDVVLYFMAASFIMTILAIIGIWKKDNIEYFGTEEVKKMKIRDYIEVIKHNRALQMLIVAASTDKLALVAVRGSLVYFFSNILLNSSLMGKYSMWQMVPSLVITFIGVEWARKSGIKKSFVISTWASAVLLVVLIILTPIFVGTGVITLLTLLALQTAIGGLAGNIVIPMIADCIDYEVYRTDNYIPGMMGTIFSFVDKLISSGATFVVGLAIAWAGFGKTQIPVDTFVGNKFTFAIMFILFGLPLIGHIASLIAMKFYILDGAMMYKIKEKIAARKAGHHNARLITK